MHTKWLLFIYHVLIPGWRDNHHSAVSKHFHTVVLCLAEVILYQWLLSLFSMLSWCQKNCQTGCVTSLEQLISNKEKCCHSLYLFSFLFPQKVVCYTRAEQSKTLQTLYSKHRRQFELTPKAPFFSFCFLITNSLTSFVFQAQNILYSHITVFN